MKKLLRAVIFALLLFLYIHSNAQCGAGYTQAQLNWDKLDYYYNSGSNVAPYGFSTPSNGNYVTNAMEQTQKFAIGPNYVTIVTSAAGVVDGENGTHTGDVSANYSGDDAQFTPSASSQTITITFNTEVQNMQFTLYDVDLQQRIDFSAKNAANVAQNIGVVTYAGSIITISNNNATNARIDASNTASGSSSNTGTATITVGTCKSITLTISSLGTDPVFWLSDINACVSGSFPTNYNQTGNNRPLQGPVTNQPDYFLITPDNNSIYMVDPATGNAWFIFTDPEKQYINSMAYDPFNHILYYVAEAYPATATNKKLKKYDFNTGTIATVFNDITTALNIPTFDQSLEGAGAAFYNGQLYLGIEGGRYNNTVGNSRESMVFRIDFDASLNPINTCQVFSVMCYNGSTMLHDWADFVIKNGTLYNFNSQTGTTKVSYEHFNMMTGATTKYLNPGSTAYASQSGMDWAGNLYSFFTGGIAKYNENGTIGALTPITLMTPGTWPGGAGDASENYRPQVDFGDAPSSFDPNPLAPASHAQDANLKLGSGFDKEWVTKGQTALANSDADDGLPYANIFNSQIGQYLTWVNVYNNTGANATVCAWLDYNGDGVFQTSEGVTTTVGSSASVQSVGLYWPNTSTVLSYGSFTYLRIRITSATNGMTTAYPGGYFPNGEVEDYRVPVDSYPLSVQQFNFNAQLTHAKTVKIDWSNLDETNVSYYMVERTKNNIDWETVDFKSPKMGSGEVAYEAIDKKPEAGVSYYRVRMMEKDGKGKISTVKKIDNRPGEFSMVIAPNPAIDKVSLYIHSETSNSATLQVINSQGALVYRQNIRVNAGTNYIALPVGLKLSNGRYVVQLTTDSGSYSKPLVIKK